MADFILVLRAIILKLLVGGIFQMEENSHSTNHGKFCLQITLKNSFALIIGFWRCNVVFVVLATVLFLTVPENGCIPVTAIEERLFTLVCHSCRTKKIQEISGTWTYMHGERKLL